MLIQIPAGSNVEFHRGGGSIVIAQIDIWQPTTAGWKLLQQLEFRAPVQPVQSLQLAVPAGNYTAVFQCFVQESLNGVYEFLLKVANNKVYADKGDVNTTPAKDDTKVYKDQFVMKVV